MYTETFLYNFNGAISRKNITNNCMKWLDHFMHVQHNCLIIGLNLHLNNQLNGMYERDVNVKQDFLIP